MLLIASDIQQFFQKDMPHLQILIFFQHCKEENTLRPRTGHPGEVLLALCPNLEVLGIRERHFDPRSLSSLERLNELYAVVPDVECFLEGLLQVSLPNLEEVGLGSTLMGRMPEEAELLYSMVIESGWEAVYLHNANIARYALALFEYHLPISPSISQPD